jgi:signal transduction histidine kinase/pSer/pThr/pTyr-binding forkhead associated (FHA) protein
VPRLTIIKGADEGKLFELTADHVTVGRDAANKLRLNDTEVSRRHAEFVRTPDGYRLRDLGSVNGSFVNEQAARDVLLRPGDQVLIGQTVLVFNLSRDEMPQGDLADRINLIARQDVDLASAIVRTVGETQGSRLLTHPDKADAPWLRANLGVIYEAVQAVSHILDLDQLLDRIMDLIFLHLDADRGCIMLRPSSAGEEGQGRDAKLAVDEFEPKAPRWRDPSQQEKKIDVSRTVMEYVLKEKQGVLVSDAARDQRFQAVQSIVRFGVREIICVPMKGRHETLGVLYLDSRTAPRDKGVALPIGKFNADHLNLAIALAHQAALAVEETRYHQAMVQAERLAAVGQTIAALSHHIKNILHGLKFGGEMLKKGIDEMDAAYLNQGWIIVEKNQAKVYDLVMDMLSYSKDREPNLERVDLNGVLRDVVELVAAKARERNIVMNAVLDEKLPPCFADKEGVHRALLNLVGNAFDAVEESDNPAVTVSSAVDPDGATLCLTVEDNGTGIPPEKLREIFRPFVSTKGARGTGLGLAVSRKILREHGGDIVVESETGKGSKFVLRLPVRGPGRDTGTMQALVPTRPPEAD